MQVTISIRSTVCKKYLIVFELTTIAETKPEEVVTFTAQKMISHWNSL